MNFTVLDGLSSEAREGLKKLRDEHYQYLWEQPVDNFLLMLQDAPDRPEYFPKGKWATIQHIQALLNARA